MQAPAATHPSWTALLTGKKAQQPAFMAARMLIVRCHMDLAKNNNNPDELRNRFSDAAVGGTGGSGARSPQLEVDLRESVVRPEIALIALAG